MTDIIELWHISDAKSIDIKAAGGLNPTHSRTCIGGQKEGIYFFSSRLFAKNWVERNAENCGSWGTLCRASVLKQEVTFDQWRLDLFFNKRILSALPLYLNKHLHQHKQADGYVPLNLPSQYAQSGPIGRNGYGFVKRPCTITGLYFKESKCTIAFDELISDAHGSYLRSSHIRLSHNTDDTFLGLADTLVDYLGRHDEQFLTYYNMELTKEISRVFQTGAVKCIADKTIPVKTELCNLYSDASYLLFWSIVGKLFSVTKEMSNRSKKDIIQSVIGRAIHRNCD